MSTIQATQVTKRFGSVTAIDNLTFDCTDGEFIVVLGKPGAGKSTLLKMLAGIEVPDAGTISFNNEVVNDLPPEKRRVAMAFETYALYPHMSVRDNLLSPLTSPNNMVNKDIREKRIKDVTQLLEIEPLIARKPSQLSGGQRQRISLARALVKAEDTKCVLLDEPISHLDARLRNSLRGALKRYLKDKGATVVYTTADYAEALGIADRIIVLIDGSVRMFAPPVDVYSHPIDLGVADMIGDPKINFFDVNQSGFVQIGDYEQQPNCRFGQDIQKVGLRPMDIGVSVREETDTVPGIVYVTEPIGYDQIVRVLVNNKLVNVKLPLENNPFSINQPVWLDLHWKDALLFDGDGKLKGMN